MGTPLSPFSTGFWEPFCENGDPFQWFKCHRSPVVLSVLISLEVAYFEVAWVVTVIRSLYIAWTLSWSLKHQYSIQTYQLHDCEDGKKGQAIQVYVRHTCYESSLCWMIVLHLGTEGSECGFFAIAKATTSGSYFCFCSRMFPRIMQAGGKSAS